MKKILITLLLLLILSCTNTQKNIQIEVKENKTKHEIINTGHVLKMKEKEKINKPIYSSKLSLQEKIELIQNDEDLKQETYLEKEGNIEGSKIKIIRGEKSFDYSFKYIEKEGIEFFGTELSEDIKSITITPIIYDLDSNLDLGENEIYKSDYINKESFSLKLYQTGKKSFKYNAFYKYKVFTPTGISFEIKYEFDDGSKVNDFVFIKGIYGKMNINILKLLEDKSNNYVGYVGNDKYRVDTYTKGPGISYLFDIEGNIWTDYGYGIIKDGFVDSWEYVCGVDNNGYIILGGPDIDYNKRNNIKVVENSNFNYSGYAKCGFLYTIENESFEKLGNKKEIIINNNNLNSILKVLNNSTQDKKGICLGPINELNDNYRALLGFNIKFFKNNYNDNYSYLLYAGNGKLMNLSHCYGLDGTTITYYGTYENGKVINN